MTAAYEGTNIKVKRLAYYHKRCTLEYGIDVGQGISVGHSINRILIHFYINVGIAVNLFDLFSPNFYKML